MTLLKRAADFFQAYTRIVSLSFFGINLNQIASAFSFY